MVLSFKYLGFNESAYNLILGLSYRCADTLRGEAGVHPIAAATHAADVGRRGRRAATCGTSATSENI